MKLYLLRNMNDPDDLSEAHALRVNCQTYEKELTKAYAQRDEARAALRKSVEVLALCVPPHEPCGCESETNFTCPAHKALSAAYAVLGT